LAVTLTTTEFFLVTMLVMDKLPALHHQIGLV
jgi:hypothetical protein